MPRILIISAVGGWVVQAIPEDPHAGIGAMHPAESVESLVRIVREFAGDDPGPRQAEPAQGAQADAKPSRPLLGGGMGAPGWSAVDPRR